MTAVIERRRARLQAFDFVGLLVEELGWNHHGGSPIDVQIKERVYPATPIAEKAGFVVWRCDAEDGRIPAHSIRRQIERQITQYAFEHLIVFVDDAKQEQVWQWVKREQGKPDASREYTYRAGQTGEPVLQRLSELKFGLEEEGKLTISLVAKRVKRALNAEQVTRRFYEDFQRELKAFESFIKGIEESADSEWYASLTLNRLMFIYFVQKRGFLDGDTDYLRNRLTQVREAQGPDQFHSFYRSFLRRLVHEGLGRPKAERAPELAALLGEVPFLNGGIFDVHDLERDNPDISIPDEAFERLFDLFDRYAWHLDERARANDNEINPDVLGHIFEKSINQKEKGAYYTKEDITGYIGESTIIPRLLATATSAASSAFTHVEPDDVLCLLQEDPDRYIRPALGHGLAWDARDIAHPVRIDPFLDLPPEIEAGVNDPDRRTDWDQPASSGEGPPPEYAHPRETWRHLVARRERYLEVREMLASGGARDPGDVVTLNVDGLRLILDAINRTDRPELVGAIWGAVSRITVLDPTCGSGAFLFAALKVLEPIYAACIERMRDLRPPGTNRILAELEQHPSERYFILKSIVLNNLYGVDIMKEATEICKLRLFLKLVAQLKSYDQIEPLPDIDFNIRPGNALVGFSSISEIKNAFEGDMVKKLALPDIVVRAEDAATSFKEFRRIQSEAGVTAARVRTAKEDVRQRMRELRDELDRHLASEYGSSDKPRRFERWRRTHQPFHWCAEFFGVIEGSSGFDVVIGNPPYIGMTKVRKRYAISPELVTKTCPDVYAAVVERSMSVMRQGGWMGMIVPLSLTFGQRFQLLRSLLYARCLPTFFSSFDRRPSKLFSGGEQIRNTIFLGRARADGDPAPARCYTTRLHRWFQNEERPTLFNLLSYLQFSPNRWGDVVPKLGCRRLLHALEALLEHNYRFHSEVAESFGAHELHFSKTGYNWLTFCVDQPSVTDGDGKILEQTGYDTVRFSDRATRDTALVLLNGRMLFLWWIAVGDSFHLTKGNFHEGPLGPQQLSPRQQRTITSLLPALRTMMEENIIYNVNAGRRIGNYNLARCRDVTDYADKILLDALGVGNLWDDIELEYSHVVRTEFGDE